MRGRAESVADAPVAAARRVHVAPVHVAPVHVAPVHVAPVDVAPSTWRPEERAHRRFSARRPSAIGAGGSVDRLRLNLTPPARAAAAGCELGATAQRPGSGAKRGLPSTRCGTSSWPSACTAPFGLPSKLVEVAELFAELFAESCADVAELAAPVGSPTQPPAASPSRAAHPSAAGTPASLCRCGLIDPEIEPEPCVMNVRLLCD